VTQSGRDSLSADRQAAGGTIYVYALANLVNEEIYVGISRDVAQRVRQHNRGTNRYTKAFRPWRVFYTEGYSSYSEARKREKYFKAASGKAFLRKLLRDSGAGSLPA
jgi:putative endonuclease